MNQTENKPQNPFATLSGGVEIDVVKLTEGAPVTEKVKVRMIPLKLYPNAAATMADDLRWVEMLCDKPQGWADDLHPASFLELLEKGEGLNSHFFVWFTRKFNANKKLLGGEKFDEAVTAQLSALKGQSQSSPAKQA